MRYLTADALRFIGICEINIWTGLRIGFLPQMFGIVQRHCVKSCPKRLSEVAKRIPLPGQWGAVDKLRKAADKLSCNQTSRIDWFYLGNSGLQTHFFTPTVGKGSGCGPLAGQNWTNHRETSCLESRYANSKQHKTRKTIDASMLAIAMKPSKSP